MNAGKGMRSGITEDTLRDMLEASAVREVLVIREVEKWILALRLGGTGSRWMRVRSRRGPLRRSSRDSGRGKPVKTELRRCGFGRE